jgi:hypothetical protein
MKRSDCQTTGPGLFAKTVLLFCTGAAINLEILQYQRHYNLKTSDTIFLVQALRLRSIR